MIDTESKLSKPLHNKPHHRDKKKKVLEKSRFECAEILQCNQVFHTLSTSLTVQFLTWASRTCDKVFACSNPYTPCCQIARQMSRASGWTLERHQHQHCLGTAVTQQYAQQQGTPRDITQFPRHKNLTGNLSMSNKLTELSSKVCQSLTDPADVRQRYTRKNVLK
ncbi:hypothetical protein TNIN_299351 [Trichonephila inaurata madagascariensis]|uniref:Uncharacterized protein n=1 Tax=Trichonephila inaurata madagascariensis TaxID=2747483 RepID=A0A8X7BT24_9ARAC|nr:hypothetical protein TNIN_299351 [Trichonephila inaurata madagascariensis]